MTDRDAKAHFNNRRTIQNPRLLTNVLKNHVLHINVMENTIVTIEVIHVQKLCFCMFLTIK